ncbi:copper homeostasis protein CutC [Xylariales sp. PMI_506]|nr:copper homeostasis protein CutC [Xylariales sp. PMI_506]
MAFVEVACFNVESALVAARAGASRIEFCADRESGGVTPDLEDLKTIKSQVTIPVYVMIRTRAGDFTCTEQEFAQMEAYISMFKPHADGFVMGLLHDNGSIDAEHCAKLVAQAMPRPCTFHRAFDYTGDLLQSLSTIKELGFKAILTSGGPHDAIKGQETLAKLVENSKDEVDIIVGGGVRSSNIQQLATTTKAKLYHTAAIIGEVELPSPEELSKIQTTLNS